MNPMDSRRRRQIIIRGALFLAFLAALVFLTIRYGPEVTRLFSRPYRTREYLRSFGLAAPLIYILFQVIQVVVAFIPGEVVQVAGGFVFGTILGTVYSVVGAALGTLIAFLTARALGFSLVRILVPRETFDRLHSLINSPRSDVTVFILFLMPGVPKDPLTYLDAGPFPEPSRVGLRRLAPGQEELLAGDGRLRGGPGPVHPRVSLPKEDLRVHPATLAPRIAADSRSPGPRPAGPTARAP
jgi:hypothetical protein